MKVVEQFLSTPSLHAADEYLSEIERMDEQRLVGVMTEVGGGHPVVSVARLQVGDDHARVQRDHSGQSRWIFAR